MDDVKMCKVNGQVHCRPMGSGSLIYLVYHLGLIGEEGPLRYGIRDDYRERGKLLSPPTRGLS